MKKPSKKFWKILFVCLIGFVAFLVILDDVIMPIYVRGKEEPIPNVVGKNKNEAIKNLESSGFNPIVETSRFDQKYQKDQVIFQKPNANTIVKINRRVYLTISGGEPMIKMPALITKTFREAQLTLERAGLNIGKVDSVESEFPINTIVEQQYFEGKDVAKGSTVALKVSIGPKVGMIRVPNLLGKSLIDAETILRNISLRVGNKTYINSPTLLPNTIVDQQPAENNLVNLGDSVNVVLTQTKFGDKR